MHSETLSTAPILAVAHFIIRDLWPGVKSPHCIRPNSGSLRNEFNSYNSDSDTRASASYQLNLVSFDNFHYRIRLIHLLHPPLLLLGRCSVFFSARHRRHMQLSRSRSLAPAPPPLSCQTDFGRTDPCFLLPPHPTKQE